MPVHSEAIVVELPTGGEEPRAQVRELAEASGYSYRHTYRLLEAAGVSIDPFRGVPLSRAREWLKTHSRPAKKATRAAIARQLRETVSKEFGQGGTG
jgi:hypothetical protein